MKIKNSSLNPSFISFFQKQFKTISHLPLPSHRTNKILKATQPVLLTLGLLFATISTATTMALLSSTLPPFFAVGALSAAFIAICSLTGWSLLRLNRKNWKNKIAVETKKNLLYSTTCSTPSPQTIHFLKTHSSSVKKISFKESDLIENQTKTAFSLEQTNLLLAKLSSCLPHLKHLELNGIKNLQQVDFSPLNKHSFHSLTLKNCEIEDSQLKQLLASSKKIKKIELIDCFKLTADALLPLADTNLNTLVLEGCRLAPLAIDDTQKAIEKWRIEQIKEQNGQNDIQQLIRLSEKAQLMRHKIIDEADGAARGGDALEIGFHQLNFLLRCKKLKELTITHVNEEALEKIIFSHTKLQKITLLYSNRINAEALARAIHKKPTLEMLKLGCLPKIDSLFFEELAKKPCADTLQLLLPLKESNGLFSDKQQVNNVKDLLKINYKWVGKVPSPVDCEGIWQRRF